MDMFSLIFGLIVMIVAAYLVGAPLLKTEAPGWFFREKEEANPEKAKEAALSALAELEFDYQMHKLDQIDYEALKNKYRQRAVEALQEEESELARGGTPTAGEWNQTELDSEIETEIQEELQRLRGKKS